jgi:hypothetical protein
MKLGKGIEQLHQLEDPETWLNKLKLSIFMKKLSI